MIQAVLLFLVAMLLMGAVGRFRRGPRVTRKPRGPEVSAARKCSVCGTYMLAGKPEPCGRADCPQRRRIGS